MQLPLHIAVKLQQLEVPGTFLPASLLRHAVVDKMRGDGILQTKQLGGTKALVYLPEPAQLVTYLHNHFGIGNLADYIALMNTAATSRASAIVHAGDSKIKRVRTFEGFPVNVAKPVACTMYGLPVELLATPGLFTFVQDYRHFIPGAGVTIVGIENSENFANVHQQMYLFQGLDVLFVSRYPQNGDLIKWLMQLTNPYLHFGDLDFEGINIYLNEFKVHLGDRARFFVPPGTEALLPEFGNRTLYNRQLHRAPTIEQGFEPGIRHLLALINTHHKVLEQEIFISPNAAACYPGKV